jgi:hypothetical protein
MSAFGCKADIGRRADACNMSATRQKIMFVWQLVESRTADTRSLGAHEIRAVIRGLTICPPGRPDARSSGSGPDHLSKSRGAGGGKFRSPTPIDVLAPYRGASQKVDETRNGFRQPNIAILRKCRAWHSERGPHEFSSAHRLRSRWCAGPSSAAGREGSPRYED